jgi:putative copper resistance protein D
MTLLTEAGPDPVALVLLTAAGGGYVVGVRRLSRRGRRWPVARSAAFAAGLGVIGVATVSGLAAYDTVQFSAHVVQHLLLGLVAPVLLVLGRPVTLALQAARRPGQTTLVRFLHHPAVRAVAHPLVGAALFASTLWVLWFSPLYDLSVRNDVVHGWLHVHFVVVGVLFYGAVLAADHRPVVPPAGARLGLAFLAVPLHAFVGVALLSTDRILGADAHLVGRLAWQGDALADQRLGAALLLTLGEVVGVAVIGLALGRWMVEDLRAARRIDRVDAGTLVGAGS